MKKTLFLFILSALTFSCNSRSQNPVINGQIVGLTEKVIYIAGFDGDQEAVSDSVMTDTYGNFSFTLSDSYPAGMYRLILGKNSFLDLIYNHNDIGFTTTLENPRENLKITKSIENLIFYDYLRKKHAYQHKTDLLYPLIFEYPDTDPFHQKIVDKFSALESGFRDYTEQIIADNPNSLSALYIMYDRPLPADPGLAPEEHRIYLRNHYFKGLPYDDPRLLSLGVLPSSIIGYLALYRDPEYSKQEQARQFTIAIDSIVHHMMSDEDIYHFTLQYLIEGFEVFGFDQVVEYIANNYSTDGACINEKRKSELERRMENIQKLSTGKIAPDIEFGRKSSAGSLEDIPSDYTLIVFWASWCTHCKAMMPDLIRYYNNSSRELFEIVSVSVDTSGSSYTRTISELGIPWFTHADLKGWNTQPALDYNIYATPMMFLLDKKRKIVDKPANVYELKKKLTELNRE
ncbi:MAG: TlpA disulfide reductase family protein [Bacteroidales bacterium]